MSRRTHLRHALLLPAGAALLAAVLLLAAVPQVLAGNGLYGDAAPDDAAFVRVVNAGGEETVGPVWIGAAEYTGLEPLSVSAYRPVAPEIHQVMLGDHTAELIARAGDYYTVVYHPDGLAVLEDTEHTRPDRAQIIVYNFSQHEELELRTAEGETTVVPAVPESEARDVAVNPVPIELALFAEGEPVEQIGDLGLARGQSYAVFAVYLDGELQSFTAQAELEVE